IEPGVDDTRFEVHIGEERSAIGQRPEQTEFPVIDARAAKKNGDKGNHSADGIGKTGGELRDTENGHRQALHPEEHRRLFPEWFIVDINAGVIMELQHFAGGFGKIDLIPVEQVNMTQEWDEEQRGRYSNQQNKYRFIETHLFQRFIHFSLHYSPLTESMHNGDL